MKEQNKKLIESAKTVLSDKMEQSHEKYMDWKQTKQQQQQLLLQQQQAVVKYNNALELQKELVDIFSCMSAPAGLQQIRFPSDLRIETRRNTAYYHYRWSKEKNDKIAQSILNLIKDRLNDTILLNRRRLYNTVSSIPYPDNAYLIQYYPYLANGFRVIGCIDSLLEIELVIQA